MEEQRNAEWNAKTPNNGPIRVVVDSAMEGGLKIEFLSHPRWYKAIRFAAYGKWPRISATTQEDWRALHTEFIFTKGQGFSTRLKNHFGAPEWTISEIRFLKKEFADFVKVTKFHPCHMSTYKIKYRVKRMKLNYFA